MDLFRRIQFSFVIYFSCFFGKFFYLAQNLAQVTYKRLEHIISFHFILFFRWRGKLSWCHLRSLTECPKISSTVCLSKTAKLNILAWRENFTQIKLAVQHGYCSQWEIFLLRSLLAFNSFLSQIITPLTSVIFRNHQSSFAILLQSIALQTT